MGTVYLFNLCPRLNSVRDLVIFADIVLVIHLVGHHLHCSHDLCVDACLDTGHWALAIVYGQRQGNYTLKQLSCCSLVLVLAVMEARVVEAFVCFVSCCCWASSGLIRDS